MPNANDEFDIAALEKEEAEDGYAVGIQHASGVPLAVAEASPKGDSTTTESQDASPDCAAHDCDTKGLGEPDTEASAEAPTSDADVAENEDGLDEATEEVIDPCLKCGVEKNPDYPMCRSCGYYSTLDTFVDVDEDDPDLILGKENTGGFEMPTWGWVLIGIQVFIILESLFVTINFPNGHIVRMVWSIAQLAIGFAVALSAHARATFLSVMADADSDIGDFVLKPFKVWGAVAGDLPKTSPLYVMVASGIVAVLLSLCLIRSIPFNKLFESDAPPPKAPNLAKAIADRAKEAEDPDMTMEEALDEFAGEAMEEEELDVLRTHEQGVVIGYYAPDSDPNTVSSIIVATAVKKKLTVLGTFSQGIDAETKAKLAEDFRQIRRKTPFVETSLTAKWVQPVYLCEVSYLLDKKERPRELRFERMLGKAKLPRRAAPKK